MNLKWITKAYEYVGLDEIPGTKHHPLILEFWKIGMVATNQASRLKEAPWKSDETPWCGGFVAGVLGQFDDLKHHIPKSFPLARSWLKAGTKIHKPAVGCVVIFERGSGGHVGFVVGKDAKGNLMVLGGNQSNEVNVKPFSTSRVLGYRWCGTQPLPAAFRYDLPILKSDGKLSTNEA